MTKEDKYKVISRSVKELLIDYLESLEIKETYIYAIFQCLPLPTHKFEFLSWIVEKVNEGHQLEIGEMIMKANLIGDKDTQSFTQEEDSESDTSLTDIQHLYLRKMYLMGLTPGAKPYQSSKIIADVMSVYIDSYSNSVTEHVDDFYALAQSWRIKEPLIECLGNIGSPELTEYEYSGAASPSFTEAVLTEAGVRYIIEHDVMNMSFAL